MEKDHNYEQILTGICEDMQEKNVGVVVALFKRV
jgi:hypothetical protein